MKKKSGKFHYDEKGQFRWETSFSGGRQKKRKVRTVDGIDVEDFIQHNADDIWLLQDGRSEDISFERQNTPDRRADQTIEEDDQTPF